MDLADRVVGSALGLALGDALGAPFEFLRARNIPDPIPALERPWLGEPPGSTTDDTAMARNLMRSLVARGGLDPADVLERHLEWFRSDPPTSAPSPDASCAASRPASPPRSRRKRSGTSAAPRSRPATARSCTAPPSVWPTRTGPNGSSSSPRPSPPSRTSTAAAGRRSPRSRSASRRSSAACRAPDAARAALSAVADLEGGEELEFLVEAVGGSRAIDGPDQGFCLFTAGAAFQALVRPGDAETELRRVVSLGGDADTNAAVAGALLGARDGVRGLPPAWLERLLGADAIRIEAEALVPLAQTR